MNFKLKMVSAAVVCAFGLAHQANALTIVGNSPTTLATEQLPSVGNVTLNNLGFSATSQGIVAGNSYSIRIRLSGGTWVPTFLGTLSQVDQTTNAPYPNENFTAAVGATPDEVIYTITVPATVNTSPANTFFRLSGARVAGVASALVTGGVNDNGCGFTSGQIDVTARFFNAIGQEVDFPVGTLNRGVVIVADQGIIGAIAPTVPGPVLDVLTTVRPLAAPAASKFLKRLADGTSINVLSAPIGTFSFADKPLIQGTAADSTVDYTLAVANDGGAQIGVTASQGWGVASSISVIANSATTACSADTSANPQITAGVPITGGTLVTTGNLRTLTFAPGSALNDTAANRARTYTICYEVNGTAGNVPTSTFTGYVEQRRTVVSGNVTDFSTSPPAGPTCQAPLATATINGGRIAIRNYSPAAANAFGWGQQIRIINAGSVPTAISAFYQFADGTTSVQRPISPVIAAGGSVTLRNTDIETAMGISPPLTASNPRLVIIGATERLRVQNYIIQPGGNWVEASGGQDDGDGPAGTNN